MRCRVIAPQEHVQMSTPFIPPRDLLAELEPAAERLMNRHLGMAKEWFPHD